MANTATSTGPARGNNGSEAGADVIDVYGAIRESILAGRHAPGERLIEARLANDLGVSRTRVRDALARLEAEHIVARAPNRGVMVRPFTISDIEETYSLRLLLEGFGARMAAQNITTPEIERLRAVQTRMEEVEAAMAGTITSEERLVLIREVTELNNEFHRLIQLASRNSRLQRVVRMVVDMPLVFRSFYWYTESELSEAAREHEEIIEALVARDGDRSEQLMRRHITRGLNTLRREITDIRG